MAYLSVRYDDGYVND